MCIEGRGRRPRDSERVWLVCIKLKTSTFKDLLIIMESKGLVLTICGPLVGAGTLQYSAVHSHRNSKHFQG